MLGGNPTSVVTVITNLRETRARAATAASLSGRGVRVRPAETSKMNTISGEAQVSDRIMLSLSILLLIQKYCVRADVRNWFTEQLKNAMYIPKSSQVLSALLAKLRRASSAGQNFILILSIRFLVSKSTRKSYGRGSDSCLRTGTVEYLFRSVGSYCGLCRHFCHRKELVRLPAMFSY